jgi:signal transduction histidine kinase/CheY-like chemotaxis protein
MYFERKQKHFDQLLIPVMYSSLATSIVLCSVLIYYNVSKLAVIPILASSVLNIYRAIYAKTNLKVQRPQKEYMFFITSTALLSGLFLGSINGYLVYQQEQHIIIVSLLILAGSIAGASTMYSPFPKIGISFCALGLLPSSLILMYSQQANYVLIGILIAVFLLPISLSILKTSVFLQGNLELTSKLSQSQDLLKKTLDHMPGPVYAKDKYGEIIFSNTKFLKVVNDNLDKDINEVRHFEEALLTGTGEKKFYDTVKFPLMGDEGLINGMANVSIDVTEKKRAEKDLENQKKLSMHNSKLAMIGELAANIGHEVNNPLAIIIGKLERIKTSLKSDLDLNSIIENVEKSLVASARIKKIVQGLKNFSRIDSQEYNQIDLNDVISESVGMIGEIYRNEGIKIETSIKDGKKIIWGNYGQLQQVLMNFLSNARHAVAKNADKKVKISIEDRMDSFHVSVADNGTGISEEIRNKIFQPFFTSKPLHEGTGLGLSISHSIAKDHKGVIEVESIVGEGSTFSLVLPRFSENIVRVDSETPDVKETDFSDCSRLSKILLIEDEELLLEIIGEFLSSNGFEFDVASNGEEALKLCVQNEYSIIITDMQMPIMNGLEFINNYNKISTSKRADVILMTGGSLEESKGLIKADLVSEILYKPFDNKELSAALAKFIHKDKMSA